LIIKRRKTLYIIKATDGNPSHPKQGKAGSSGQSKPAPTSTPSTTACPL